MGLIIGVAIHGVPIDQAFHSYTILTVGDGLVSQIPALIVSTAAGLLVSKGGVNGKTGDALGVQLGRYPKAFGMVAALMGGLAIMPGLPFIPFAAFAALAGWLAWKMTKRAEAEADAERLVEATAGITAQQTDEPVSRTLAIDSVRLEIGYALLPLINDSNAEPRLDDQVRALRRQMALDFGFVLPSVRIIDNMALQANEYVVYIKETEAARGEIRLDKLLVINADGGNLGISGEETREPVFNLPALWIAFGTGLFCHGRRRVGIHRLAVAADPLHGQVHGCHHVGRGGQRVGRPHATDPTRPGQGTGDPHGPEPWVPAWPADGFGAEHAPNPSVRHHHRHDFGVIVVAKSCESDLASHAR